jgi:hypothetical protein
MPCQVCAMRFFFSKLKDTQILDEKYVSNIHEYFIAYSAIIERMWLELHPQLFGVDLC